MQKQFLNGVSKLYLSGVQLFEFENGNHLAITAAGLISLASPGSRRHFFLILHLFATQFVQLISEPLIGRN